MILAVRHGRTPLNEDGIIIGHSDISLSPHGIQDAHKLGAQLQEKAIEHIIASDLRRARETARIIQRYVNVPLQFSEQLREINYGLDTGKNKAALRQAEPRYHTDPNYQHAEGESFQELYDRVTSYAARLQGRTLLVTHSGCIRALYAFDKGKPFKEQLGMRIPHTKVFTLHNL